MFETGVHPLMMCGAGQAETKQGLFDNRFHAPAVHVCCSQVGMQRQEEGWVDPDAFCILPEDTQLAAAKVCAAMMCSCNCLCTCLWCVYVTVYVHVYACACRFVRLD